MSDLAVTQFRNGDNLHKLRTRDRIHEINIPSYQVMPDGTHLYNWYAVNDARGLAPKGLRIPGMEDWLKLQWEINGGMADGAVDLAELNPHTEESLRVFEAFNALSDLRQKFMGSVGMWWSSTLKDDESAVFFHQPQYGSLSRGSWAFFHQVAVRCIVDVEP